MVLNVYTIFGMMALSALVMVTIRGLARKSFSNSFVPFLQYFVGSLFIFSGFVKAVDPMGTSYKMHDYFGAMQLSFLNDFSTPIAVLMIVAEIVLGAAIIVGWLPKLTASLLLLLNVFFLLLTGFTFLSGYCPTWAFLAFSLFTMGLISVAAIIENYKLLAAGAGLVVVGLVLMKFSTLFFGCSFDKTGMKVTDCGCFGDFIKLEPWETFYKDVILTIVCIILVLKHWQIQQLFSAWFRNLKVVGATIFTTLFCLYNFVWAEPVIDFRPYAIGEDLNKNREVIKPEKKDYLFIYKNKKTGESKEVKTNEIAALNPEEWEYAERKDIVLEKGTPARITNLNIFDNEGTEITDELLHYDDYSLVVVAYKLSNTHPEAIKQLNKLAADAINAEVDFYGLTSEETENFCKKNSCEMVFFRADETPLKTMMRSNPGLLLLKNGVVINKWHYKHLPTFEELNKQYFKK